MHVFSLTADANQISFDFSSATIADGGTVFKQINARPHVARSTNANAFYLAATSDFSSMEQVWNLVEREFTDTYRRKAACCYGHRLSRNSASDHYWPYLQ